MPDDEDLPPMPDEDTSLPADPFEAELVAYLDGELDPAAARRVEARLAADPEARARAASLKKTFDLLDYLPRPEPSPSFTTRTLDRLPAMKSGGVKVGPAANSAVVVPATSSAPSSSVPVALATSAVPLPATPPAPPRWWAWAAGIVLAASAFGAAGYFVVAALTPPPPPHREPAPTELPLADHRVVENLPLYAAADDLEFVQELAKPDLFGDDPAVSFDSTLKPPAVEPDKPSGPAFEALAEAFKALPPARQQAVRELDRQLRSQEPPARDRLFRVLEAYAVWLHALPEAERKKVLAAPDPKRRLDLVREARDQQWFDSLPPAQRALLAKQPPSERAALIAKWKDEEAERRAEWAFVRSHAPDIAANKTPWPFDDDDRRKDVVEFARVFLRTDDEKKSRLSGNEFERVRSAAALAEKNGGWAWWAYGKVVYDLTRKYESFLLPEPAGGEPITRPDQLPKPAEKFFTTGGGAKAVQEKVGKWPDFALTVHGFPPGPKLDKLPPLGPARPGDFKEPLKTFIAKELIPALEAKGPAAAKSLEGLEGRWPDYPREVVKLARQHDLVAPGLMLPGSPKRWDAMYNFGARLRP